MKMDKNWAIELSRVHKPAATQANIYGVVLYTAEHAHISKVLADEHYWNGLNEASGPHWVVFASSALPGKHEFPPSKPGSLSLMVPVWKEPSENKPLLEAFDMRSTEKLPALVVFVDTGDDQVDSTFIELEAGTTEAAYDSLRVALNSVNQCVAGMDRENRQTEDRAFRLVQGAFENQQQWRRLRKTFSIVQWLRSQG